VNLVFVFLNLCLFNQLGQGCDLILIDNNSINSFTLNCFANGFLKCVVKLEVKLLYLVLNSECTYVFKFFELIHDVLSNKNDIRITINILHFKHSIVNETWILVLFK